LARSCGSASVALDKGPETNDCGSDEASNEFNSFPQNELKTHLRIFIHALLKSQAKV
jgi:hypothetical protein